MRWLDDVRDWWERRSVALACREVVELMTEYLEDALGPDDRRRFEEHLAHCEACTDYLEQLRTAIDALAATPVPEPAPEVREHLLDLYRRYHDG